MGTQEHELIEHCLFDAGWFRENCFCVVAITVDFVALRSPRVKAVLRPGRVGDVVGIRRLDD